MFGYTRDGGYSGTALLHRDMSQFKPRLTYYWRDDTVGLDGEIYDSRLGLIPARWNANAVDWPDMPETG